MQIFHISAARNHSIDQPLDAPLVQQALQIQQRNAVVTAQHVDGADAFFRNLINPAFQILPTFALEHVD